MTRLAVLLTGPLTLLLLVSACGGGPGPVATSGAPSLTAPTPTPASTPAPTPTVSAAASSCPPSDVPPVPLTAPDGVPLLAYVRGDGQRGVVLGHESDGGLCDLWSFGTELVGLGYRVLSLAFEGYRGSGSGPAPTSTSFVEPYADDLLAGVALLHAQGVRDVAVVGPSMGGTAAVVAGSRAPQSVRAVVDLSGPAQYIGLDAVGGARTSPVPQLLAVGTTDRDVDETDLQAVDAASAATDKQLLLQPGSAHGKRLLATDPQVHAAVLAFLDRHLPVER